jgi:hypothetical protein
MGRDLHHSTIIRHMLLWTLNFAVQIAHEPHALQIEATLNLPNATTAGQYDNHQDWWSFHHCSRQNTSQPSMMVQRRSFWLADSSRTSKTVDHACVLWRTDSMHANWWTRIQPDQLSVLHVSQTNALSAPHSYIATQ